MTSEVTASVRKKIVGRYARGAARASGWGSNERAASGLPKACATQRVCAAMQLDKQEAKWRDQFKTLGREAVRDKLHAGVYWRTRQSAVAERWLREQEAAEDSANKWVHAATIAGVVIALFSLLMMFG